MNDYEKALIDMLEECQHARRGSYVSPSERAKLDRYAEAAAFYTGQDVGEAEEADSPLCGTAADPF